MYKKIIYAGVYPGVAKLRLASYRVGVKPKIFLLYKKKFQY